MEITSWAWGSDADSHRPRHSTTGGGTAARNISELTLFAQPDKGTIDLIHYTTTGRILENPVALHCLQNKHEYLRVTLNNAAVAQFRAGTSHGTSQEDDTFVLNFQKVKMEYYPKPTTT